MLPFYNVNECNFWKQLYRKPQLILNYQISIFDPVFRFCVNTTVLCYNFDSFYGSICNWIQKWVGSSWMPSLLNNLRCAESECCSSSFRPNKFLSKIHSKNCLMPAIFDALTHIYQKTIIFSYPSTNFNWIRKLEIDVVYSDCWNTQYQQVFQDFMVE